MAIKKTLINYKELRIIMSINIEQSLKLYNEAMQDSILTDAEKAKLEKAGINEELIKELSNKSQEEMIDVLERSYSQEPSKTEDETPWYKSLWSGAKKVLGSAVGFLVGKSIGSKLFRSSLKAGLFGVIGAGAGLLIASYFDKKDAKNVHTVEDTGLKQEDFMVVLPETTDTVKPGDNLSKISKRNNARIKDIIEANPKIGDGTKIFPNQVLTIPERRILKSGSITNLEHVSIATGVTKSYIKDILFGLEGRHKEPDLKPYYDGIPAPGKPKGVLTIGFGHTGPVKGVVMTDKNKDKIEITPDEAHEMLAQDILNARKAVIDYIGDDFYKAPVSIQNALIDICFNKGIELGFEGIERDDNGKIVRQFKTPTQKLKNDLKKQDYVSAAQHIVYETPKAGLKKRNIYRAIVATKDLSFSERNEVLDKLQSYMEKTKMLIKPKDASLMQQAWDNARNGICTGFFD